MKYTAEQVKEHELTRKTVNGWKLARPVCNDSLFARIKQAIGVITGRYDVLEWRG